MLAIEIEFLLGRYYAADFRNETLPEWPPHPDRLFEALAAAHHDSFGDEQERRALLWFEKLGAPEIAAGASGRPDPVVNFVPTNYDGTKSRSPHPDQRGKQPRSFPVQSPSSAVLHFIWRDAQPDVQTREKLRSLLERVPSLGRACSFIRARLTEDVGMPNWRPDNRGRVAVRVFGEGRLEELETLYNIGRRPSLGAQRRYSEASDSKPQARSSFGEMIIIRRVAGPPLPIEAALTLTSAARRALMSRAEAGGDHALCELLSGHGDHSHCSLSALPFAAHEYADGRLMGVALVLPRDISQTDRRKLIALCAGLEQINIKDNRALWTVELSGFDMNRVALRLETWIRPSTVWASVTPVILDRFPKRTRPVEDIVCTACEHVGLPAPIQIEHGPYSGLAGVSPVPAFRIRRTKDERPRWGVHVKLQFAEPVHGPILLGAGRFFGLGLLKPLKGALNDRQ